MLSPLLPAPRLRRFRRTTALLVIVLALLANGLVAQGTITGIVTDRGRPLSDVEVLVEEFRLSSRTNSAGEFFLSVPAGRRVVLARGAVSLPNRLLQYSVPRRHSGLGPGPDRAAQYRRLQSAFARGRRGLSQQRDGTDRIPGRGNRVRCRAPLDEGALAITDVRLRSRLPKRVHDLLLGCSPCRQETTEEAHRQRKDHPVE